MPRIQAIPNPTPISLLSEDEDSNVDESSGNSPTENDTSEEEEEEIPHEDYQKIRDIPLPPAPKEISLSDAIKDASVERLRAFLLKLASENAAFKQFATKCFLSQTGTNKRKSYETCKNCGEEYRNDAVHNYLGACIFHEGEKEVDDESDTWADHDERCHGDPYHPSLMNDPVYADGYMWSCCAQPLDAEGCIISRHVPKVIEVNAGVKRRRY